MPNVTRELNVQMWTGNNSVKPLLLGFQLPCQFRRAAAGRCGRLSPRCRDPYRAPAGHVRLRRLLSPGRASLYRHVPIASRTANVQTHHVSLVCIYFRIFEVCFHPGYLLSLQQAQLSQRDRAMLRVIEYFAKSFEITQGHSKRYHSKAFGYGFLFAFHSNRGCILYHAYNG